MIGVIDYRIGNLQSLTNALVFQNIPHQVFSTPEGLDQVDKLILPGVGAFGAAVDNLHALGFFEPIKKLVGQGMPILGVCVGMQVLFQRSEEDPEKLGFQFLQGEVGRFKRARKIPHTGWNQVQFQRPHPLLAGIEDKSWFYFTHAYKTAVSPYSLAITDYEEDFSSIVNDQNIYGIQFHPEKSQQNGLRLIKNFTDL